MERVGPGVHSGVLLMRLAQEVRCTGRSHRAETRSMWLQARSAKDGWPPPDTEEVKRLPQSESQPALPAP